MSADAPGATIGILGGGALGLGAALRLAEAGCRVTVLEREPHLGGLAAGFQVGPTSLEKFYHHIFRSDTTIIALIGELGLADRLVWQGVDTSVLWHGQIARLESPADFLRFRFLPPVDRLRWVMALAFLKAMPDERTFVGQTALTWTRRATGPRVSRVFWEPLLRGKFGERAPDIAMPWLWSRFHERSFSLGYLRGGFQQLYDTLGERVRALGGEVLTGTAATSVQATGGAVTVETDHARTFQFSQLLVTLPTRLFMRLAPGLPPEYATRYPGPDHFGAHVAILGLDRALMDGIYWLNVTDRDLPFLAVVEHTNLMPPQDYGGIHLVYLGNYLPMDDPLFSRTDEQVLGEFLPALRRVRPDFDPAWLRASWIFKAPYAQPIVTVNYLDTLPPHRTPLPGVYLANMAHVYPQDRGQNYSLRLGQRVAGRMLAESTGGRESLAVR